MMKKKSYSAPEVDIEKFSIPTSVMTSSTDLDEAGVDADAGYDWDF